MTLSYHAVFSNRARSALRSNWDQMRHNQRLSPMRCKHLSNLLHAQCPTNNPSQQNCISRSASQTGGNSTDLNFICKSSDFLNVAESCEAQDCDPSELIRTYRSGTLYLIGRRLNMARHLGIFTLAIQLCDPVGGTVHIGLFNLTACAVSL